VRSKIIFLAPLVEDNDNNTNTPLSLDWHDGNRADESFIVVQSRKNKRIAMRKSVNVVISRPLDTSKVLLLFLPRLLAGLVERGILMHLQK
jgi:hypothetical protein